MSGGSFAWAGIPATNVLLVVNPNSQNSMLIANHYAALRHIPAANILYIPWDAKLETTDVATFREKILGPVMYHILTPSRRRQIDCITYSADFPWGIDISADITKFKAAFEASRDPKNPASAKGDPPALTYTTPMASINGLTFLWRGVLAGKVYMIPNANWYLRTGSAAQSDAPSLGFSSAYGFDDQGKRIDSKAGNHYMLSTVLAVTSGRGNTVDEVLNYLRRSVAADGSRPPGTIYFVQNDDIRSRVRRDLFPAAVEQLKKLGVKAEILDGITPHERQDVQGLMMGIADFDWPAAHCTILPGAICEHFTSFGGVMNANASQTPLSVFLRYGAAAASGTVTEPYAIAAKFPTAMMQVHYARGCNVAESFYQTIAWPYQLLIVGDPLCAPWAAIPKISLPLITGPKITAPGLAVGSTVSGVIHLQPKVEFAEGRQPGYVDILLESVRLARLEPGAGFDLNTAILADGLHELRFVAVEKGTIGCCGELVVPLVTSNRGRTIEVHASVAKRIEQGEPLTIEVKSPGSTLIQLMQGSRLVGVIKGSEGKVNVDTNLIGAGPVRIIVGGDGEVGTSINVIAAPIDIEVVPRAPREAKKS